MSWIYIVAKGMLTDPPGKFESYGYSGQPPYTNEPMHESLEGNGPLPRGKWTAKEVIEEHPKLGAFVIVLSPDDETRARVLAMGRNPDSFRVHGERVSPPPGFASDGCLVQPLFTRKALWASTDHDIEVI